MEISFCYSSIFVESMYELPISIWLLYRSYIHMGKVTLALELI